MVMGLGDVYLGAPCAVPVDPRHRLVVPKYNPARTYTPEGELLQQCSGKVHGYQVDQGSHRQHRKRWRLGCVALVADTLT